MESVSRDQPDPIRTRGSSPLTTAPVKTLVLGLAVGLGLAYGPAVPAAMAQRQYYDSSYTYSPIYGYYYVRYYYQPAPTYTTYDYHYCIYYPSRPDYLYYYNPVSQAYWGRYKVGSKENERYSILAEKDRKKDLKEIPESAFPAPAAMPAIPGSKDGVAMEPPPENVPRDAKP
jgi:hypothetical protein